MTNAKNNTVMAILNNTASSKLNRRERKLWNQVRTNSGVLMAIAIPGVSKSATFRTIADKMEMQYIDLRTSTMDETDLGAFPTVSERTINNKLMKVVDQTVPAWAIKANEKPTLIHFEELNRCSSNVRSAALGILLERVIGAEFKFNNNVFMVASGNPVTEHDMDVEEFGSALRNRLIPINFTLSLDEWKDGYADENVLPEVIGFLTSHPEYFGNTQAQAERYIDMEDNFTQYPSPRSWTFLSDYIKAYDLAEDRNDAFIDVETLKGYVGDKPAIAFAQHMAEVFKVSATDILNGVNSIESINSTQAQRILQEFQDGYELSELKTKQIERWSEFVETLSDTLKAGHISTIIDKCVAADAKSMRVYKKFLIPFNDIRLLLIDALEA
jgi:hypothetical protein